MKLNVSLIILTFLLPPMNKLRVESLNNNKGRDQHKMALDSDMIPQEKIDIIRHSDGYKIPSVLQSKARLRQCRPVSEGLFISEVHPGSICPTQLFSRLLNSHIYPFSFTDHHLLIFAFHITQTPKCRSYRHFNMKSSVSSTPPLNHTGQTSHKRQEKSGIWIKNFALTQAWRGTLKQKEKELSTFFE